MIFNFFFSSTFGGGSGGGKDDIVEDEPINIFSVASGHLYERFLRIMMLSVIKHTKSPVKFWFLKNYLSPSFKVKQNFEYNIRVATFWKTEKIRGILK